MPAQLILILMLKGAGSYLSSLTPAPDKRTHTKNRSNPVPLSAMSFFKKVFPFHWGGRSDGGTAESHSNCGRRSLRMVEKTSHEAFCGCDGCSINLAHAWYVWFVNRYMAGRERIVDKASCLVDVEESCIDS